MEEIIKTVIDHLSQFGKVTELKDPAMPTLYLECKNGDKIYIEVWSKRKFDFEVSYINSYENLATF